MPRARREQENFPRQKNSRGGKLKNTPPRQLNGTAEPTNQMASSRFEASNSTSQTTDMSSSKFTPLLLGTSVANGTSLHDLEKNVNSSTANQLENTETKSAELGHASGLLSSSLNDTQSCASGLNTNHSHRPLSSILSQWTKKGETHPVIDPAINAPTWIQTYKNFGLTKAVAAAQALNGDTGNENSDEKTKELKDELMREKAARILVEQLLEEQREQHNLLQHQLEDTLEAKQDIERQYEQRISELQATLATAQESLELYHNSNESVDWVLDRQEVILTENVIGIGGWGKVIEGKFCGTLVAVKQIHDLILSPHNRRLFEREMNIASRCRHPCLLQFIGATNDDGSPLFVTELLDTSLRAVLQERALEPDEITTIALDVARALNYLHLRRPAPIIHRDISSANVLLWKHGERWRAKVSDYGTANFMQYSMTVGPGAVAYSAPEAQTSRQSPKVDVYSFGVLLCEMNIREFPDVMHRNEQVSLVTNHIFREIIRSCLFDNPEERPSMAILIDTLELT